MALKKCKECGEPVSTKAKQCPKCGASAPKKTSIFTWVVLMFFLYVSYIIFQSPSTPSGSKSGSSIADSKSNAQDRTTAKKKAPLVKPSWSTSTSNDKMTGKVSAYASSPRASASKDMSFPYSNVQSWMGVGCNSESEWVYFGFNSSPNLARTDTEDGYNVLTTRLKWDDEVRNVTLTQEWGGEFLHLSNDRSALVMIAASNSALLELQWHGQQSTYFQYSLNGSARALA